METKKTPESKRKANDKWDKENMTTLGCKVKKQEAAAFKQYANNRGKTSNNLLKEYVTDCITSDGYNEALEPNTTITVSDNEPITKKEEPPIIKVETQNDIGNPITLTDEEVHACTPYWESWAGGVLARREAAIIKYKSESPEWLVEQVKIFKTAWNQKEKQGGLYADS